MVAIILAAGYATRLYPMTKYMPKALLCIGGKPMLDYIVDKTYEIPSISKIAVVSNGKFYGHFVEWKKSRENCYAGRQKELLVLNDGTLSEETRLGAIGDIQFAIDELHIDDDLLIIAGDNFFTFSLLDFHNFHIAKGTDCVVVKKLFDREMLKNVGVATISTDNRVLVFEEKPKEPKSDYAVYASYIYMRETLPLFKQYLDEGNPNDAPGHFPAWLCKINPVFAYEFDGECYDIGTHEAYGEICRKYKI